MFQVLHRDIFFNKNTADNPQTTRQQYLPHERSEQVEPMVQNCNAETGSPKRVQERRETELPSVTECKTDSLWMPPAGRTIPIMLVADPILP